MRLLTDCLDKGDESLHALSKCMRSVRGSSPKLRSQDRKLEPIESCVAIEIDEPQTPTVGWHIAGQHLMQRFRVGKRCLGDAVLVDPDNVDHGHSCLSNAHAERPRRANASQRSALACC